MCCHFSSRVEVCYVNSLHYAMSLTLFLSYRRWNACYREGPVESKTRKQHDCRRTLRSNPILRVLYRCFCGFPSPHAGHTYACCGRHSNSLDPLHEGPLYCQCPGPHPINLQSGRICPGQWRIPSKQRGIHIRI